MADKPEIHEDYGRAEEVKLGSERAFGVVFALVFAVVGLWPLMEGGAVGAWALGIGAVFILVALARPGLLRPLNRLWFRFGLLLNKVVNPLVMGLLFYFTVTPIGLLMRALGKDPLRLRFDPLRPELLDRTPTPRARARDHAPAILEKASSRTWTLWLSSGRSSGNAKNSGCCPFSS